MSSRPKHFDKFDWLELQKQAQDCGDGQMPGFFEFLMRDDQGPISPEQMSDEPEDDAAGQVNPTKPNTTQEKEFE
ncbi:MAG: hypothetical protein ABJN26_00480 [Stappiaceae bacterium]